MKRFDIYFALLAIAAIFVILAACGSGEPIDLSDQTLPEYVEAHKARSGLTNEGGLIDHCKVSPEDEICAYTPPVEPESSSSYYDGNGDESSSSYYDGGGDESSSSYAGGNPGQSSGGTDPTPPSSSSFSSSSAPPACVGDDCAKIPTFTCAWKPDQVTSGDNSKVSITYDGDASNCRAKVWVQNYVTNSNGFPATTAIASFVLDTDIRIAGRNPEGVTIEGATNANFEWPGNATVASKATVTCGSGSTQNEKTQECPLIIGPAPAPTVTGSVSFKSYSYSSGSTAVFFIGTEITAANNVTHNVTVTNAAAGCGTPWVEFSGCGAALGATSVTPTAACDNFIAKVVAECRGSTVELKKTAEAAVAPDPVLSACSWEKDVLAKGQTATPKATITNNHGRCGAGNGVVTFSGGFPKELTEQDVGTISNVVATATCTSGNLTQNCPALTVKSAIYEITEKGEDLSLPTEETIIKVTLPTSNWEHNSAYITCNVEHLASGTCSVVVAPVTSGCGTSSATLSGQNYLGRESIGKPTCGTFDIKVTPTSNCNSLKCNIN